MTKQNKEIQNKNLTREINIAQIDSSIDDLKRTVEIAFMSETPVKREIGGVIYDEILITTPDSVDLSRLNTGAPLLWNHNMDALLGVVENARIDSDRVGRAIVRFSTESFADGKFNQVKEGVLTKVSFGYNILDYYIDGTRLIVTQIEPYELSMVSCPADNLVGVGRSLNTVVSNDKDIIMDEQELNKEVQEEVQVVEIEEAEVVAEPQVEVPVVEAEPEVELEAERKLKEAKDALKAAKRNAEVQTELEQVQAELNSIADAARVREIESIAKVFKVDASEAINSNTSVEEFKRSLELHKEEKNNVKENEMSKQTRTIDALVAFAKGDHNALNELESGERGYAIQAGEYALATRAATTTVTAEGALQTNYSDDFIRPLLAESILGRLGVEVITGMGNREFTIPRLTSLNSKASFRFYAEGEAMEETVANFDNIVMKPKLFAGAIPVSKSLMLSSPDIGTYVQRALIENLSNSLEKAIIEVAESTATKVQTAASGVLDDGDIEAVIQKLLEANVRTSESVAVVSPAMYAKLRQTPFLSNVAGVSLAQGMRFSDSQWLCEEVPLIVSTFVEDNTILVGNFSFLTIANWTGSTLDVDTTTYRSSLTTVFRNYHYLDVVQKHPEAVIQLKVKA